MGHRIFLHEGCIHEYDCDDYWEDPDKCRCDECDIYEHEKIGTQLCETNDFALSGKYYLAYFDRRKKLIHCIWSTSKTLPHVVGME